MPRREIPRENWMRFLDDFSRNYRERIVKIEITDDEDYRVDYAESLPFQGAEITSVDEGNTSITVLAGASSSFRHVIDNAGSIIFEEHEDHAPKVLQVRSSLGRSAIVRFHPVSPDENVR
ncbi:MAG TPA: DUF5335 family protein [Ignavibacteriales bacterium]|nr:DUF5335 family protein [Ignavibacteriales bacterium]